MLTGKTPLNNFAVYELIMPSYLHIYPVNSIRVFRINCNILHNFQQFAFICKETANVGSFSSPLVQDHVFQTRGFSKIYIVRVLFRNLFHKVLQHIPVFRNFFYQSNSDYRLAVLQPAYGVLYGIVKLTRRCILVVDRLQKDKFVFFFKGL